MEPHPVKRPATVVFAQVLLVLTALGYLASPFFVLFQMDDTLAYYGISVSDRGRPLITAFILRLPVLVLIVGIAGFASWGLVKGNRLGRAFSCGVFAWVFASLLLDVLWPDDNLRISRYLIGFPQWLDALIKLALAAMYFFITYRIGFGIREGLYFNRYKLLGYTDPPRPPTFSE